MNLSKTLVAALATASLLSACAAPGPQPALRRFGVALIQQITARSIASLHHQASRRRRRPGGLGIDRLIAAGTGRDVAMVAGAIGGAVVGNEVQKKHDQPIAGQQIIVRLGSGVLVQVTQPVGPSLAVGQRVYIEGSGENARIVPQ